MLGTGPYIFDYWDKGTEYRLTRNPHYWKGWSSPAHADNFVSKTIATWATRRDVFIAGDGDVCTVPNQYKSQVEGIAGIICLKDLSQLTLNPAAFFNQWISPTSTYAGVMPANGTFTATGFPCDGFTDIKLRKAFRALFPYDTWLSASYLGEATQPASAVCEGLAYYDPSIPKPLTDMDLAIKLLKEAWGGTEASPGPVWTNGFYMSLCYNSGNEPRKMACEMFRDAFESINSATGTTHFTGVVTEILWTDYSAKWKTRVLPFYFVGWGADFPDAHNFVVPFMESVSGAFAKFQGFTNETVNTWIREGIDSIDPVFRQDRYTKLQQAFVDNCYSIAMAQPLGRHWIRDWAQGFYYHSCMAGEEYAYYRWKEDPTTMASSSLPRRDVEIAADDIQINPTNVTVTVTMHDRGLPPEYLTLRIRVTTTTTTIITQAKEVWVKADGTVVVKITVTVSVTVVRHVSVWITIDWATPMWKYEYSKANNYRDAWWYKIGDVNGDGTCNMVDIQALINHFMVNAGGLTYDRAYDIAPGPPAWTGTYPPTNYQGGYKYNTDGSINMLDIQITIQYFMKS
jgi:peptide/nickel transport system substrate-binding protein